MLLLFAICMIWIFGKILFFGIKAAWGISKFLLTVILLPLLLIGYSCCRIDLHSISDIACGGNCVCFYFKSENILKIKQESVKWLNSIKKVLE